MPRLRRLSSVTPVPQETCTSSLVRIALVAIVVLGAVAQAEHHKTSSDIPPPRLGREHSTRRANHQSRHDPSDLMNTFTTAGGLSTASQRTYVYRECPFIQG